MDSVEISTQPVPNNKVETPKKPSGPRRCLSCGESPIKAGRRYCSTACRQQINWVLSLSKGLLKTFNARYAAFSFTREHVILDVLPVWSNGISRFICRRNNGKKPAEDLKNLILESGREWHHLVDNRNSKSYASLFLLTKNHIKGIDPRSIKPSTRARPRLSRHQDNCLKILRLERKDLSSDGHELKIKAAYKKMAKLYHPDVGGDAEKFRQLTEANQQMLLWAQNPQYTSRKALRASWSYDGSTNRWSPPL
jgi:hypothetical protein